VNAGANAAPEHDAPSTMRPVPMAIIEPRFVLNQPAPRFPL